MPESKDWDEIKRSIAFKDSEVKDIDDKLADSVKITEAHNKEQAGIRTDIETKRRALQNIEFSLQSADQTAIREYSEKKRQLEASLQSCKSDLLRLSNEANGIAETKKRYEDRVNELRVEWNAENAKELVFDQSKFECPTCKRPFEANDIEEKKAEMAESFNVSKLSKLNAINDSGVSIKAEIKKCENQLAALEQPAKDTQTRLNNIEKTLSELKEPITKTLSDLIAASPEHKQLSGEIAALSECLTDASPVNNESLKFQKSVLLSEIDLLKSQLYDQSRITEMKVRISELERQHKEFAGQLAELEGIKNTIFEFEKAKIEAVEGRINAMFSNVRFRMFRQLINGTSEPCCEATVNGVPYPDVNNAGKINAGLDIINAISQENDVCAPIFIDNSEAVNELFPISTQLIRLVVTTEPKLTISNN
jgi:chromosome segregation ATPase